MHAVFLTRKYPPSTGGMETFSYELGRNYSGTHTVVAAGRRQRDIWWVAPLLLWRAFRLRRTATVYHLGDYVLVPLAPFIKLFSKAPIVATVHALELQYKNPLLHLMLRASYRFLAHTVAVSEYTADLARAFGVPDSTLSVIVHGVTIPDSGQTHDEARVALISMLEDTFGLPSTDTTNCPLLLTVGRLQRRKGVEWFIRNVLPSLAHLNPLYLVTSTGPEQSAIEAAITESGTQEMVRLLGKVPDDLLELLYAGSDTFIMPNIPVAQDAEGFGFVAIEAAARGLPVFASELEGITSAIHDGKNGYLLAPQDPKAWSKTLTEHLSQPQKLQQFGSSAATYTKQHFTWTQAADKYQQLFTTLESK